MDAGNRNLLIRFALYAGAAWGLYWLVSKGFRELGGAAGRAVTGAGQIIGGKVYDLFHPSPVGETLFYTVTFPNGTRHSVPSSSVNTQGQFTYSLPPLAPRRWQLLQDAKGFKIAQAVM